MKQQQFPIETSHKDCVNRNLLGWHRQTIIYDISGCDWNIETYKREGAIRCCASMGYANPEDGILFIPTNRPLLRLHWERRYCTKKAVIEVHEAGIKRFDLIVASGLTRVPQYIKDWVRNEKLRVDIKRYASNS
ncbi:hypothetical protein [Aquimarina aggregata]|uniref:hypothetical protein n=1 Tax=Aquimarina aggregata TaxID=1642818 RepID=UPI002492823F|nr:hypothetical protein [Aquimarina aggregata]